MTNFLTYRKFPDEASAREFTRLLEAHGIPFEVDDSSRGHNDFYMGAETLPTLHIKIPSDAFTRVNSLLDEKAKADVEEVQPDHYLYSFSKEELMDVVMNKDEWNELDAALARKILKEQGIIVTDEMQRIFEKKRYRQLTERETMSQLVLAVGYLLALAGGPLGVIMGLFLWSSKKTLPDGKRVPVYTNTDRQHGLMMAIIGTLVLVAAGIISLLTVG